MRDQRIGNMGAGNSSNFHGERIDCGQHVGHSDVSNFIRTHDIQGEDRRILQGCYDLFESKPDFVWQNCSIEVMCSSVEVKFVSGDESNRYLLRFREGEIWTAVLREEISTQFFNVYEWLFNLVKGVGEAVAGAIQQNPNILLP
ncbi:uncharacterized protein LOC124274755 [Haliotis rubra]|uniref:uncharacterized protein LOC124274755 n=1 Tax=Haliotis rubra TaxID=36100 RepID=UPI001EE5437D|nr:uncharacterized protein LOC124274755 [Haliotis rubra]